MSKRHRNLLHNGDYSAGDLHRAGADDEEVSSMGFPFLTDDIGAAGSQSIRAWILPALTDSETGSQSPRTRRCSRRSWNRQKRTIQLDDTEPRHGGGRDRRGAQRR